MATSDYREDDERVARLRAALVLTAKNAGAAVTNQVTDDFLMFVPEEVRLKVARLTRERNEWKDNFDRLCFALVGNSGLSAMMEAKRLRELHPLADRSETA